MEEKERYIYTKIDGYYWIKDTETNENYCVDKKIVNLLNQQDKHIKEFEKIRDKGNQKLENFYNEKIDKLDSDYNKHFDELIEENQQLKQSQYQRAIEVLEAIRRYLDYKVRTSKFSYNEYVDFVNLVFSRQIDILSCKQNDKRN